MIQIGDYKNVYHTPICNSEILETAQELNSKGLVL